MQNDMVALSIRNKIIRAAALFGLALAVCLGLAGGGGKAAAGLPTAGSLPGRYDGKVERRVLDDTANGKSTGLVVLLAEQADLSPAYAMRDQDARGWFVYNALKATAERSQAGIRAMLTARGVSYKPFWVANMLVVSGDRALVESLAARSDVRLIESNDSFKGISDPVTVAIPSDSPQTTEWGVQRVNAPQVWALGYTGQGIVIGNQDTGMRWTHNAIRPKYRGWNGSVADHNYNWWDAIHSGGGSCGSNTSAPCDDQGHGTHTTGTTAGDDGAGNQVGVAPGARWIGCRNMDQGNGTPATYTECFQFFIAPTDLNGNNPDPSLRPHVMNNSWGCPPSEGCAATTLQTIVENTQAAGIFVEASAGNSGPSCSTVSDPPSLYGAAFATGAIDINNVLASFSSRGPVTADGSNRLKPNISAPGVSVRSSTFSSDTSYGSLSGTSMAGPHVVGVVALLWSAHPELSRMITETKTLLQNTANPGVTVSPAQTCGGIPHTQIPNNSFGYGRVDALAAVNAAGPSPTPTATVTGTPPTATSTPTRTRTPTPTPTICSNYGFSTSTGATIVPGTTDIGNHCDDCATSIALPFAYSLYGQSFTAASVNSNGTMQFTGSTTAFSNVCLPTTTLNNAILAQWDDLLTNGTGGGIFTSVSGTAPNRIFNIEWRTTYFSGGGTANFEIRLYEGQSRFDIVYGQIDQGGSSATVGVQRDTGSQFAQFECNTAGSITAGLQIVGSLPPCGTAVPTFTVTRTSTPTNTPTNTATNTPTPLVVVRGHVLLQGRPAPPDPRWSVPVTLTLRLSPSGPTTEYTGLTTDNSGYFTITAPAPGTYDYRVKNPQTISNSGIATLIASTNTVEMGTLLEGDANNDNCVNVIDFTMLKSTFGKSAGDPGYDARADFNGDAVINVTDFNMQKTNFGFCGSGPLR